MKPRIKLIAAGVMAFAVTAGASASIVTLTGEGFRLSYDSTQSSLFSLNAGSIVGNSISFLTSPISATALNTTNNETTVSSSFAFQIAALDGYTLTGLNFTGSGAYDLSGGSSSVSSIASVDLGNGPASYEFGAQARSGTVTSNWSGSNGGEFVNSDWASVLLSTKLTADTNGKGASKTASISLTDFGMNVGVVAVPPVPEPEAYMMLLAGLGLVGAVARRRSNTR